MEFLKDKVVMITGGTGSFGKAMAKKLYSLPDGPSKIIIYSRDEYKQGVMMDEVGESPPYTFRFFIGDVRDRARLVWAMKGVDIVIHAAAMKQVDACEYNPIEACYTNISGTRNVFECALDNRVKKFLLISTDKAVAPVNLYGRTKGVAESLVIAANTYAQKLTALSAVRYGNVLGSRGSVLEKFREQAEQGVILITDNMMTRFWWTMGQAIDFVIKSLEEMRGGEIFVPKLGSAYVKDLAIAICPHCRIREVGARPGEKIHEVLISQEEAVRTYDLGWGYCVLPDSAFFTVHRHQGPRVPDVFDYTSSDVVFLQNPESSVQWLMNLINAGGL